MPENLHKVKQEIYKNIFKYANGGIAIVGLNGNWIKVNDSIVNFLGYSKEELYEINFQKITHRDDLNLDLGLMDQLLKGEIDNYQIEKRYFHKKGHIIWALLSVSLVRNIDGTPLYFISQLTDISSQKSSSWHLQFLMNVIKGQNEKLKDFAHIATHDLRTHIGNLNSITEFLEEELPDIVKSENYQMLHESISNLNENLKNLTKIQVDKPKKFNALAKLSLYNYVKNAMYNISSIAKKENCQIINNVKQDIYIFGIEAYLDSIVLNFLTNAIKYRTEHQPPIIELTTSEKNEYIVLHIKDNGKGINLEENKARLFTLNGTFHNHQDSRGVGLYITKNHIESIGGKIEVESQVGKGTCFSVYFLKA
ncbi:sensor histidine kinase [Winogradskyella ouciana]|uniref:histidine kinase n=1 Tax=Winogradskyella ouciana TaxID=2608631 RepID=A0A7K1GB87_9FLAO|nr:HAMP domain-containing sensor histidine kinase [Winogradskyella ouciana]MTE26566.1 PAS domain S-box protein [Winogradskyella ouciana]